MCKLSATARIHLLLGLVGSLTPPTNAETSKTAVTPFFTWGQTDQYVIVTAPVRTGSSTRIVREDVSIVKKQRRVMLSIRGRPSYHLDLRLHQAIYTADSTWEIRRESAVVLKLFKKQAGLTWLRLLEDEDDPLLPKLGTDWGLAQLGEEDATTETTAEDGSDDIIPTDRGKQHIVMKDDGEDIACEVCRTFVHALENELARRRQVADELHETIMIDKPTGRESIRYSASSAIVEEFIDEVCHTQLFDEFTTVRAKDGHRIFVRFDPASSTSSRTPQLLPNAKKTLERVCRETIGEFDKQLVKLFRKKKTNRERAICEKLTHACDVPNRDWQTEYVAKFGEEAGSLYEKVEAEREQRLEREAKAVPKLTAESKGRERPSKPSPSPSQTRKGRKFEELPARKRKSVPMRPPASRVGSLPTPTAPTDGAVESERLAEEHRRQRVEAEMRRSSYENEL